MQLKCGGLTSALVGASDVMTCIAIQILVHSNVIVDKWKVDQCYGGGVEMQCDVLHISAIQ